jgi:hypothetical protein
MIALVQPPEERQMPISRSQEEAERDIARETAEIEARGYAVMGGCMSVRADGSVVWVICPGEPLREPTREEAAEAERLWAELQSRAEQAPPWTPQLPEWRRGDEPTGRDPEGVRLIAERKRQGTP